MIRRTISRPQLQQNPVSLGTTTSQPMSAPQGPTDLLGLAPYGEAIREATTLTLEGAGAFLGKICLPAAEEFGLLLRDRVSNWRSKNLAARLSEASVALTAKGVEPREIPMRTAIPLLEGASREDESSLAVLWSALIANAANPDGDEVPPIFPVILGQLSPLDARVLACISTLASSGLPPDAEPQAPARWGARRSEIGELIGGVSADDLDVAITVLMTLGLVFDEPVVRASNGSVFLSDNEEFCPSPLGQRFLSACAPLEATKAGA